MTKLTLRERFEKRVAFPAAGVQACWNWVGYVRPDGYGTFQPSQKKTVLAHRFAYELFRFVIPEGLALDHLCRNRRCVNPDHLEPVTVGENVRRGTGWASANSKKTQCPKGHPYDDDNTYRRANGQRGCRKCMGMASAKWQLSQPHEVANKDKTHCPKGHEYTADNIILSSKGGRVCRTCNREACKRRYDAKKRV